MNENEMKTENSAEALALADINEEKSPAFDAENGVKSADFAEASKAVDDAENNPDDNAVSAAEEKEKAGEPTACAAQAAREETAQEESAHENSDGCGEVTEMKPFVPAEVKPARFVSPAEAWSCGTGMTGSFSSDPAKAESDEKDDGESTVESDADSAAKSDGNDFKSAIGTDGADCRDDEFSDGGSAVGNDVGGDGETDSFGDDDGYDGGEATDESVRFGEPSENTAPLTEEETRTVVTNPMFALFARGKSQPFDEICRDFIKMTAGARNAGSRRMVTPAGSSAVNRDVALSDRQRKLAREYGMSYREYYELINGIPTKLYK